MKFVGSLGVKVGGNGFLAVGGGLRDCLTLSTEALGAFGIVCHWLTINVSLFRAGTLNMGEVSVCDCLLHRGVRFFYLFL